MDAQKTVRDSVRLMGGHAATTVAGILFLVLAARWLTDVEIAALAAWEVLIAITRVLTSLGLVGTLTQRVPIALASRDLPLVRGYMRLALTSALLLALPVVAVFALGARHISSLFFDTPAETELVHLVLVATLTGRLFDQLTLLLTPLDRFRLMAGSRIAHDVVLRLSALGAWTFLGMRGLFGTIAIGQIVIGAAIVAAARREILGPATRVPLLPALRYSIPFYWNGYLRFGVMQLDQLAVSALLGPHELATYFLARRLYLYLEAFVNHFVAPLVPKLAALRTKGPECLAAAFNRSSAILFLVVVPPAAYIAVLSGPLVSLLGDGAYDDAGPVLAILTLAGVLFAVNQLYVTLIFVAGLPRRTFELNLAGGLSSAALVFTLGGLFGVWGVALSRVLSQLVTAGVGHVLTRTFVRARPDFGTLARAGLRTALAVSPVIVCLANGWHAPITMPVLGLSGVVCLVLLVRMTSLRDRELVLATVPSRARGPLEWVVSAIARESRASEPMRPTNERSDPSEPPRKLASGS